MFTSRAEFRLLLRQDNADLRLTRLAYKIGMVGDDRIAHLDDKEALIASGVEALDKTIRLETINTILEAKGDTLAKEKTKVNKLVARPKIALNDFAPIFNKENWWTDEVVEQLEIGVKYGGYIERERENVEKMRRLNDKAIPEKFDYQKVKGLSFEGRAKLEAIRPATIAQAGRISGISQSDIHVLLVYMGR